LAWKNIPESIGSPKIAIEVPYAAVFEVKINWQGDVLEEINSSLPSTAGESLALTTSKAEIVSIYDPQSILSEIFKNK
jgi:hypothetical protein